MGCWCGRRGSAWCRLDTIPIGVWGYLERATRGLSRQTAGSFLELVMTLSMWVRCALLCALAFGSACKRAEKLEQPAAPPASAEVVPSEAAVLPTATSEIELPEEIMLPPGPKIDRQAVLAELGSPSLVMLRKANGRCEWSVLRPPQLEERLFLVSGACPDQFTWDIRARRALFVVDGAAYLHDWRTAKVERLEPPPLKPAVFGFSANDSVLACTVETVSRGNGYDANYQLMLEQQADGSWKKIAYVNLGNHSMGGSCPDGYSDAGFGEMWYDPGYQAGQRCNPEIEGPAADVGRTQPTCPSAATVAAVDARIKGEHDAIEYLVFAERSFIASPVDEAMDGVLRWGPMLSIENEAITEIYNRTSGAQKYLLLSQEHFLVATAGAMTDATLFKKGQVEPLKEFPDDARVFWIPGTIAATTGAIDLVEKKGPVRGSVAPLQ
jgi:hypothetical protein